MNSLADIFPPSERVFYVHAPLAQVVCQLRFPRILRIESQPPADFQDRVRGMFPYVERLQVQLPADMPPEMRQVFGLATADASFQFRTEDSTTQLNISPDALSLNTTKYVTWEGFCALLQPAVDALIDIYKPSFFQRVGLRYINNIDRSKLDLTDIPWSDLLRREVVAELAVPEIEAGTVDFKRNIRMTAQDGNSLFFQHGLVKKKNETGNSTYRLDFDFFRDGKTEVADVKTTIDNLNALVGRAFRWCISDALHQCLGPDPIRLAQPGR